MVILKLSAPLKYVDVMLRTDLRCPPLPYVHNCLIPACRAGTLIELVGCIVYTCEDKYLHVINMWRHVPYCAEQVNTRQQTERKAKAKYAAQDTEAALAFAKANPAQKQRGTIQELIKVCLWCA